MIRSLRIQNFKAWKDTKPIRLAPITVLFGSNSSGKSSINQMLLMLKQTAQSPDRKRVLHLGDENTVIDLGTMQDVAFGHPPNPTISVEIEWGLPSPLTVTDPLSRQRQTADSIAFSCSVSQLNGKTPRLAVEKMDYSLFNRGDKQIEVRMVPHAADSGHYDLKCTGYKLVRQQGRAWQLPAPIRFYGFPDEVKAYYQNADFVADLTLSLEQMLTGMHYLGPVRDYPSRSYTWSGEVPSDVGEFGQRTVEAILAARERVIGRGYRARTQLFEEVIARWLRDMGLIEEFQTKPIAQNRKEYEVLLRTKGSKHQVNLTDVGFGLSQVLPVLVQCFYVPANSIVILEQPEIHLHPKVQGALADLFIEAIQARENGQPRNIQLLIESHSEHFLRRLQRRIAEEVISPKDAALYFCTPGTEGSEIQKLELDLFGNINNWPTDFFGDEMSDLAAMTDAALRRTTE
jgi:predicted ATPase